MMLGFPGLVTISIWEIHLKKNCFTLKFICLFGYAGRLSQHMESLAVACGV